MYRGALNSGRVMKCVRSEPSAKSLQPFASIHKALTLAVHRRSCARSEGMVLRTDFSTELPSIGCLHWSRLNQVLQWCGDCKMLWRFRCSRREGARSSVAVAHVVGVSRQLIDELTTIMCHEWRRRAVRYSPTDESRVQTSVCHQ